MRHLFADALPSLPPPEHYASVGWICVAAFTICGGLYYVLKIVDRIRGKEAMPPNSQLENSQKDLARRVEISEAAIAGIRSEMKVESGRVEEIAARRSASIYAKMEELRREFTNAIERTREASGEAHAETRQEMSQGFKDVERALGRLEGKIEK